MDINLKLHQLATAHQKLSAERDLRPIIEAILEQAAAAGMNVKLNDATATSPQIVLLTLNYVDAEIAVDVRVSSYCRKDGPGAEIKVSRNAYYWSRRDFVFTRRGQVAEVAKNSMAMLKDVCLKRVEQAKKRESTRSALIAAGFVKSEGFGINYQRGDVEAYINSDGLVEAKISCELEPDAFLRLLSERNQAIPEI